jgi:hypothetical protein
MRWDWKGGLLALAVFGLPFLGLLPDWLHVLLTDPPVSQTVNAQTILGKFGPLVAGILAIGVIASRRWRYWQLGGALAGILSPYGMPAVPVFLILSAVPNLSAVPAIVLFAGGMAAVTWVEPNFPIPAFFTYYNPMLSIYHLSVLSMALILACYARPGEIPESEVFHLPDFLQSFWLSARARLQKMRHA